MQIVFRSRIITFNPSSIKDSLITFFSDMIDAAQRSDIVHSFQQTTAKMTFSGNNKLNRKFLGLILGAILLSGFSFFVGTRFGSSGSSQILGTNDQRTEPPKAKATDKINEEILISLKDSKNVEISKIRYSIESAELQDEILVKGQRARAVKGRTFLLINLKITNNHSQAIQINSRDYLRLTVNNKKEQLAADIHNDPVQIQAISTKYTRVGFPINDTDKNLILHAGEINGSKQEIKITF